MSDTLFLALIMDPRQAETVLILVTLGLNLMEAYVFTGTTWVTGGAAACYTGNGMLPPLAKTHIISTSI